MFKFDFLCAGRPRRGLTLGPAQTVRLGLAESESRADTVTGGGRKLCRRRHPMIAWFKVVILSGPSASAGAGGHDSESDSDSDSGIG